MQINRSVIRFEWNFSMFFHFIRFVYSEFTPGALIGCRLQSAEVRSCFPYLLGCCVGAVLSLMSGCATFKNEVVPYFNQFTGMPVSAVVSTLGKPDTIKEIEEGDQYSWSHQYELTTRVPIQSYIDGQWVTRYYQIERHRLKCTFSAMVAEEIVFAGELEGSPSACERLMRSRP